MTKTKKTLALMMVLVMAMTVFAFPVSAAASEENAVEPKASAVACPICSNSVLVRSVYSYKYEVTETSCSGDSVVDAHTVKVYNNYASCSTCGDTLISKTYKTYCDNVLIKTSTKAA